MSAWASVELAEVCSLITDGTHHSPTNLAVGDYKYVTAKNIRPWGLDTSNITYVDTATHQGIYARCPVEYGDVLYIKDGVTTGIAALNTLKEPFSMLSSVALLKPERNILEPRYLKHWLNSPVAYSSMTGEMTGTAIKRLVLKQIRRTSIQLAPLPEQKRIADKLDSVLARVDACRDRLDRLPALLKRFRQSILAAATSGQLTEDWRDTEVSSASWQTIPLGKYVENLDGKRVPISETLRSSRRGQFPYYGASGVIDTIDGYTHDGKFLLIGEDGANLLTRSKPIAFVATGKIWVNNHAHVLKCKQGAPEEYLCYFINSIDLTPYVSGSAQPKLNQKNLNSIVIPVPPIPEQTEIVRRVELLFAFADRLEARLAAARQKVGQLTPALLAKAFRGELVPQDPNDEPAAELLKRLATQREAAPKAKRGRGKSA